MAPRAGSSDGSGGGRCGQRVERLSAEHGRINSAWTANGGQCLPTPIGSQMDSGSSAIRAVQLVCFSAHQHQSSSDTGPAGGIAQIFRQVENNAL